MLIVFEGIDGCGKDTQIKLLAENYIVRGFNVKIINSCSSELLSKAIRTKLKQEEVNNKQMLCLFLAEAWELYDTIWQATREYDIVILNRWTYSTIAYNTKDKKERDIVKQLSPMLPIDKVIFLDITPGLALERVRNRDKVLEVFETSDNISLAYTNYRNILYDDLLASGLCYKIDASRDVYEVHLDILDRLDPDLAENFSLKFQS